MIGPQNTYEAGPIVNEVTPQNPSESRSQHFDNHPNIMSFARLESRCIDCQRVIFFGMVQGYYHDDGPPTLDQIVEACRLIHEKLEVNKKVLVIAPSGSAPGISMNWYEEGVAMYCGAKKHHNLPFKSLGFQSNEPIREDFEREGEREQAQAYRPWGQKGRQFSPHRLPFPQSHVGGR